MASPTDVPTIDWARSAKRLFDQSSDAMCLFQSHDLRLVEFNSRAEDLSGLPPLQLVDMRVDQLLEVSDRVLLAGLLDACRHGKTFQAANSIRLHRRDQSALEISIQVDWLPAEPQPLGLLIINERHSGDRSSNGRRRSGNDSGHGVMPRDVMTDLAERKEAVELLAQQQEQYRLLIDHAPVCIHSIDSQRRMSSINPAGIAMLGIEDARQILGRKYMSLIDEADQARIQQRLDEAYEGTSSDFEFTALVKGGQRKFKSNFIPIVDSDNVVRKVIGTTEDITDANAALEKLRIQDRAISVATTGIVIADGRCENVPIIFCNAAFERMTGYAREEAIGRNCSFLQAHDTDQEGAKLLREAESGGRGCSIVVRNYRKDGTIIWNEVSVSPVHDATGEVTHFVGFWSDISERIAIESKLRDSEQRFRTLTIQLPLGIFLNDVDGQCTFVNETYSQIVGQPLDACLGFGWADSLHPDDEQRVIAAWDKARDTNAVFDVETRFLHEDGSVVWAHCRSDARIADNGDLVGYVGFLVDITDQKNTHAELEQSEQRFRTIVENAPEAIVVLDVDQGRFSDWNQKALELFKTTAEQIRESGPWDFCPPHQPDGRPSLETAHELIQRSLIGEHPVFDFVHRDALGNDVACEIRLTRLPAGDRKLIRGSVTDITERRLAEAQLRRTRLAVESTSDAVFVIDQHGRFIDVTQTSCDRLGYTRDELLCMSVSDINKHFGIDQWADHWQELRATKKLVFESEHWTKDGVVIPVEVSKSYASVGGTEFAFAFVRDISARKQAQAELQATQFAVDQNVCAIVRINVDGGLAYVNDAACRSLQYSRDELLAKSIWDIDCSWPRNQWEDKWADIKQAGALTTETTHLCKDGTKISCEATACHVRFGEEEFVFAYYVDIRERKHAQSRLRQRESQLAHVSRFSTLGEMVAGIAHEVNQPLYSILNYSKATKNNLGNPTAESIQQVLRWNEQVKEAATRAGSIIKRLRGFVSQEPPNVIPVEIGSVINDATEIVSYELKRAGVVLKTDFRALHAIVRVDTVQIQHVIVNLLINAIEAIERLEAETRQITVGTTANSEYVEAFVADSGPGFPEQSERNLFDAFVSTKAGGMGMGLAISKTIVESFGGKLSVTNNNLGGATFTFRLSPFGEERDV